MISAKLREKSVMGGMGSGRYIQGGKNTTCNHWALDVRQLQRDKLLISDKSFMVSWKRDGQVLASINVRTNSNSVMLNYRHQRFGDWENKEYPVRLDWTNCAFGGRRAWFLCPAQGCRRRVAILYSGSIFACRHCYKLAYACQRENSGDRAIRRADNIRKQLGWSAGIANPNGDKPKGMHWVTFERLTAKHDSFAWKAIAGTSKWMGIFHK